MRKCVAGNLISTVWFFGFVFLPLVACVSYVSCVHFVWFCCIFGTFWYPKSTSKRLICLSWLQHFCNTYRLYLRQRRVFQPQQNRADLLPDLLSSFLHRISDKGSMELVYCMPFFNLHRRMPLLFQAFTLCCFDGYRNSDLKCLLFYDCVVPVHVDSISLP